MSPTIFTQEVAVAPYQCDISNHITVPMLLNLLMTVSENQSKSLGVDSLTLLKEQGIGWIVTSYEFDIKRLPQIGETVNISTRGTSYNKYFAFREFWVKDSNDNEIVKVNSIWALLNEQTRKMIPVTEKDVARYNSQLVKKMPRLSRPIKVDRDNIWQTKQYQVRYGDIDLNGHVNNVHYFDWLLDTLPMSFLMQHQPQTISIRFENEVKYQNEVTSVLTKTTQDSQIQTNHEINFDDLTAIKATITWKEETINNENFSD